MAVRTEPGPVSAPVPAVAGELLARVRAELPAMAGLGPREELLAAAWLMSLRSARTRRAYAGDLRGWLAWLEERGVDVLEAGRVHVDLWVAGQQGQGAEAASVRRRLSALSSFYRYCAAHDLMARSRRPGWHGRWWTRTTPPPSAWPATRPAPWSPPPTLTPARRRCAPRRRSGCCCTTRCGSMKRAQPTWPTSAPMPATGCCG